MNDIFALFRKLTMGVYVVAAADGFTRDAFTAASVTHVSYQPLLLSLAINPHHASYDLLFSGRSWTISVLRADQIEVARLFGTQSRPRTNKMVAVQWANAPSGAPYLQEALAYFDCRMAAEFPAGDHRIVIARVIGGAVLTASGKPLIYADTGNLDQSASLYPAAFDG
jgi:flavin reductase (DIM6/NTAB) family NADH-FMN oxidoreductase RutF